MSTSLNQVTKKLSTLLRQATKKMSTLLRQETNKVNLITNQCLSVFKSPITVTFPVDEQLIYLFCHLPDLTARFASAHEIIFSRIKFYLNLFRTALPNDDS